MNNRVRSWRHVLIDYYITKAPLVDAVLRNCVTKQARVLSAGFLSCSCVGPLNACVCHCARERLGFASNRLPRKGFLARSATVFRESTSRFWSTSNMQQTPPKNLSSFRFVGRSINSRQNYIFAFQCMCASFKDAKSVYLLSFQSQPLSVFLRFKSAGKRSLHSSFFEWQVPRAKHNLNMFLRRAAPRSRASGHTKFTTRGLCTRRLCFSLLSFGLK